jgi:mannan polymerase complexes MNN9 subunit
VALIQIIQFSWSHFKANDWQSDVFKDALAYNETSAIQKRFEFQSSDRAPLPDDAVLILTTVAAASPWGVGRTHADFLQMIQSFDYGNERTTLGFLTVEEADYDSLIATLQQTPSLSSKFNKITVLLNTAYKSRISRSDRHLDAIQLIRRRIIARARNYLLYSTLQTQPYVLWIDADIVQIPGGLLSKMIGSGKDIITPYCRLPNGRFYDYNAWKGQRERPSAWQLNELRVKGQRAAWVPQPSYTMQFPPDLRQDSISGDFVEVDSVGGTMLFVRAQVHREGVVFPPLYIVGTDWDRREGWDGVETEGLCYMARSIGYRCWLMPHEEIVHSG